ncbi:MAG: hypothetical protein IJ489_08840 [Clostridia bacterium]|nr:hypothetical protein [Clostridia bacterium]
MILLDNGQILITEDELSALLQKAYQNGFQDAKEKRAAPQTDFSIGCDLFRMGAMTDAD